MRRPIPCFARALAAAALLCAASAFAQTMVRMQTAFGPVDVELFDSGAPATVANFLGYVRSGAYRNTFLHRSVPRFVVQGGGFVASAATPGVPASAAVVNEFSESRPNVRGTIAMAKVGGNPNSATTQWFFNAVDNSRVLGPQNNGGFTVFGRVTAPSLATVDRIAALQVVATSRFPELPVLRPPVNGAISVADLVVVESVRELPARSTLSDADRVFDWLEAAFPQFVAPASAATFELAGYTVRYYPSTNAYVGAKDGQVYYLVPAISNEITLLASLADLRSAALAAGY